VKRDETTAVTHEPPGDLRSASLPAQAPSGRRPGDGDHAAELVLAGAGLAAALLLLTGAVPASWPWWTNVLVIAALASSMILFGLIAATRAFLLRDAATPGSRRYREAFGRGTSSSLPARFERMGGAEFEAEVSELLRKRGYTVRPTPPSDVHDVDLLLKMTGRKVTVQLKRWNAPVGNRAVYAAFVGRIHHGTDEAWLITTSWFTPKAVKLAKTTGVRLIDGAELADWIEERCEGRTEGHRGAHATPEEPPMTDKGRGPRA